MTDSTRREFLGRGVVGAAAVAAGLVHGRVTADASPAVGRSDAPAAKVDQRALGRTGAKVGILGLGLGGVFTKANAGKPEQTEKLLRRALAYGVNYWDTAHSYGPSEEMIGPTVKKVRKDIFLVSKSTQRDYDGFMRELEVTLKRLQTDHLDMVHIHSLRPKQDTDLAVIEKGAVRAARKAKEQGIVKHFGVTGHAGADILAEAITAWDPDAVLTVLPAGRPDGGKYEDRVLPLARAREMGVIGMKTVRQASSTDLKGTDLIRYALSLSGVHCVEVGLDTIAHLDENAAMATGFKPLSAKQAAEIHHEVRIALAGATPPWEMPGYEDAVLA